MSIRREEDYNKVMQRIYDLKNSFTHDNGKYPTTVMLGYEEYYLCANYDRYYYRPERAEVEEIMGMKVERIGVGNYLAVGFLYKEEEKQIGKENI